MDKLVKILFILVLGFILLPNITFAESRYYTVGTNAGQLFPRDTSFSSCDPFYFRADGNVYYMLVDDSNKYTYNNLLGCTWPKNSLFEPLQLIDSDNNEKITQEELKAANIRFVRLQIGRTLALHNKGLDFDINRISYIDLKWRRIPAMGVPLGMYDIYLYTSGKSLKKIIGRVSQMIPYRAKRLIDY